jgi:hypothetical protein
MVKQWSGRLAAISALGLLSLTPAGAEDPPGNLWEMTSQMSMEGMPMKMPANTVKVCTAREWTQPPPGADASCVNSNFQRTPSKVTWTMKCTGQMPMEGTGEINFDSEDSYTGTIQATAEGMAMTINLRGTKIGTCDKPVG